MTAPVEESVKAAGERDEEEDDKGSCGGGEGETAVM